jgi:hypothetical protein
MVAGMNGDLERRPLQSFAARLHGLILMPRESGIETGKAYFLRRIILTE